MKKCTFKKIFIISSIVFLLSGNSSHAITFKLVNNYQKPIFYKIFFDKITPELTLFKLNPSEEITRTNEKIVGLIISLDDPSFTDSLIATLYKFTPINYNINVYLDSHAELKPMKLTPLDKLTRKYYVSERGISKKTIILQKNIFGRLKFQERFPRPSLPHIPAFPKPPTFEESQFPLFPHTPRMEE